MTISGVTVPGNLLRWHNSPLRSPESIPNVQLNNSFSWPQNQNNRIHNEQDQTWLSTLLFANQSDVIIYFLPVFMVFSSLFPHILLLFFSISLSLFPSDWLLPMMAIKSTSNRKQSSSATWNNRLPWKTWMQLSLHMLTGCSNLNICLPWCLAH